MLLIDVMAGRTSDILEALEGLEHPRRAKHRRNDVKVRAYVVGAYFRRRSNRKVVNLDQIRKQRELTKRANRILKEHHA